MPENFFLGEYPHEFRQKFAPEPTTSLRAKGVTFLAYYVDMDGDGLLDLVMPRMDDITVWAILKVLVTGSVPANFEDEFVASLIRRGFHVGALFEAAGRAAE